MPLIPLMPPPGVYRNGTEYQASGRWYDANMMRWYQKRMQPIGGWVRAVEDGATTPLEGLPGRGIVSWRRNNSGRNAGIGTPNKLWVYDGDAVYDITPSGFPDGFVDTFYGTGYGSGDYGDGPYGAGGAGTVSAATSWSLDAWGEYLVACASHDEVIYEYQGDPGTPAEPVANAPTARAIFVTEERFLVALGTDGNPRKVAWSDQEDNTTWAATSLNQAGDIEIATPGALMAGLRLQGQSLILSTVDAHTMTYRGDNLVFGFQQVGDGCGLIAPNAATKMMGMALWMGVNNFHFFDGSQVSIVPCDVLDYVFSDINLGERAKIHCGRLSAFGETTWWYCSAESTTLDRYVTYNYLEKHWTIGRTPFLRSCWEDAGVFDKPLAVSDTGRLYNHETGWLANTTPRTTKIFAQSGPLEIGNGDKVMIVRQIIPDEATAGAWRYLLGGRMTPDDTFENYGPYTSAPKTDVRMTARQVSLQVEAVIDDNIRLGVLRLKAQEGGYR